MSRRWSLASALAALALLSPHVHAGEVACGLFADTLQAVDTTSKFYSFRPGQQFVDLVWRDLEFMWDSLYTTPGVGHSAFDRINMGILATNLVRIKGKNPFTPGPGAQVSDFHLAYDFFRKAGQGYTQAPDDTGKVLLGNFDRLTNLPPVNYIPSDQSHLDVYLVHPNHPDPSPENPLRSTSPSEFVEDDEDLSSGRPIPKPANSIQVIVPTNAASDTLWTSHDHVWARALLHEMQHGLPATEREGMFTEMFSQGLEVAVGMAPLPAAEVGNSEIAYGWGLLTFGTAPLTSCQQVPNGIGLNYEMRSLFTGYLASSFPNDDGTLADDLLRRWARSGRRIGNLRDLLVNDSCLTCSQRDYFKTGPGGSALDSVSRLALLHHNWRVATYVNDVSLAEGQYGYPPSFGFSPIVQFRCWQTFDGCQENDVAAIPSEVTLTTANTTSERAFAGVRTFHDNSANLALHRYGAEYWVFRCDSSLLGSARTLRVRALQEAPCAPTRMMASLVGYNPPPESLATGRLWAHPEWATVVTAPQAVETDDFKPTLEVSLDGLGTTYKAAVLVLTLAEGPEQLYANAAEAGGQFLKYRLVYGLVNRPYEPVAPTLLQQTTQSEHWPTWSPNNDEVAYSRTDGSLFSLYRQRLDGSPPVAFAPSTTHRIRPDWSPRGDWVTFERPFVGGGIHACSLATGAIRTIFVSSLYDQMPVFSPNGQQVAFARGPNGELIARVSLDGTGYTEVGTYDGLLVEGLRWAPSGDSLYFTSRDTLYAVSSDGGPPVRAGGESGKTLYFDHGFGMGPMVVLTPHTYSACHSGATTTSNQTALRDRATGGLRPIDRPDTMALRYPRWSFDAVKVAWSGVTPGGSQRDVYIQAMTTNHAPVFASLNDTIMEEGHDLIVDLHASDIDGDAITFVAPSRYLPAGASFSGNRFQWDDVAPAGSAHFVVFRALDPNGGVHSKVVKITVIENQGGSGCPFVDTQTAQGWQVENSILGRSLTGSFELDPYRLVHAPEIVDGKVRLRVRENEQELTTLDAVQLLAIDHPIGSQVFRLGERTVIAALSRAHRVTDGRGTDLTSRFLAGAFQGHPGDTLYVDMTDPSSLRTQVGTEGVGPLATTNDEGEGGYMNGFQKPLDPEGIRHQLANEGAAAAADVQVLNETGILVEAPDGRGGWRLVRRYYPREHEAECTLDSLGRGSLRLIFVGRHALSYIGRLTDITAAPEPQALTLAAARHSRLGSVASDLGAGGTTTSLSPGDTLDLEFEAGPVPEGKLRTYFLLSTGVYTDASSARAPQVAQEQALPARFALAQNKPNPFATTTTIDFALPSAAQVRLEVFDLQGRLVRVLADRGYEPGYHTAEWDRRDQSGSAVGAGVYLYRLRAGSFVEQRKMVLLAR